MRMHPSNLSLAGDVLSEEDHPLVSIPRPRWRTTRRVLLFGSKSLFFFAMAFVVLGNLKSYRDMTAVQWAVLLGLLGLSCFDALASVDLLRFSLKLPLQIFRSGIAFQGVKIPWATVEGCCWARYFPDSLEVRFHRLRHYLRIPKDQRADVETALRGLGKWQP
jgi:hypothetical protein